MTNLIIFSYATNIYMYLLLKSNKELNNHPVIKTLYQYRQLLSKMEPTFEEIIRPQLILLLEGNQDVEKPKEVKKLLNILSKQKTVKENKRNKENMVITKMEEASPIQPSNKKVRFMDQSSDPNASDIDEAMEVNAVEQENEPEGMLIIGHFVSLYSLTTINFRSRKESNYISDC